MKKLIPLVMTSLFSLQALARTTDIACEITANELRTPENVNDDLKKYPRNYIRKIDFKIAITEDGKRVTQTLTDSPFVKVKRVKRITVDGYLDTLAISFESLGSEDAETILNEITGNGDIRISKSLKFPKMEFNLEKWHALKFLGTTSSSVKSTDREGEVVTYGMTIACDYLL